MGLLDSVLGSVLGGRQAGGQGGGIGADLLMQVVGGLISGGGGGGVAGGLGSLLQQFEKAGLGHVVQSWVGSGQNLPISADQLQQVLGGDQVSAMAQQAGTSHGDLMSQLSQLLPQVVDQLTPQGQMPAAGGGGGGGADFGGMLSSVLGGLLKR